MVSKHLFLLSAFATSTVMSDPWVGTVIKQTAGTITGISGTFTVPYVSIPAGGSNTQDYGASTWVGIDGTGACDNLPHKGLWQTGISTHIKGTTRTCRPWYEWWPGPVTSYGFDFECSAGDVVTVNITAESSTSGNAGIINHTTGVSVGAYVQAYADASGTMYPLCQQYAEWVIEGRDQVTANFGTVVFTNPIIQLANGTKASPENGHQDTITYTDGRVAATSTSNSTMVMIKYVL